MVCVYKIVIGGIVLGLKGLITAGTFAMIIWGLLYVLTKSNIVG